ncbi:DNA-directed RNA polymerase subunit omega [bacterium]|nr:DNA-directed RNA polymerase subunit omega [bacterium]
MIALREEELLKKTDNIYILLNMTAKRARQLNAGVPKLVDIKDTPINVALEEIMTGKIDFEFIKKKAEPEATEKDEEKKGKKKK